MDDCDRSIKNSPYMIEWMAQADPSREVNRVKGMNALSLLLSLDKITHYFKEWMTASGALKKNLLSLQKLKCFK